MMFFYLFPLDAEYEDFMVNINFIIEHGRENDDLDFWEELIIDLEETIKNFNLQEKEEVKIDGLPGYKIISTGYLPEIFPDKIKWVQVVTFLEDEKFLVITYTASKKTFPEFKDDALEIIFQTKVN